MDMLWSIGFLWICTIVLWYFKLSINRINDNEVMIAMKDIESRGAKQAKRIWSRSLVQKLYLHSQNRHKIEIVAALLDLVNVTSPIQFTQMMYGANLSFEVATRYLDLMVHSSLLERQINPKFKQHRRTYSITNKGRSFLARFKEFKEVLSAIVTIEHELEESVK